MDRICFSADGKGRVGLSSKKFSFDFETLIERDKKKWSIDFHFPGGIEKIIEVDYLKSIKQQKESFKNLLKDLTKEEFNEFLLGEFWEKMSKILKESEAPYPNLNWSISKDRFIINFPQNKGHFFRLEASELNIYYQHLKVFIEREREIMGSPLELELFLNNCSAI